MTDLPHPPPELQPGPGGEAARGRARRARSGRAVLACEDNLAFMAGLDDETFKLIVTSPPYNLGKGYETRAALPDWLAAQERVVSECARILHPRGSICWEVGNYVENGEIVLSTRSSTRSFVPTASSCATGSSGTSATAALHEAAFRPLRDDQLVDQGRRLHMEPRRGSRPLEISRQTALQGANAGKLSGNPNGKNPSDVWAFRTSRTTIPRRRSTRASFRWSWSSAWCSA